MEVIQLGLGTVLLETVMEDRLFGLDTILTNQTLLSMISLLVLFILLGYLLFVPVKEFMQKRTDRIKGEIDQAADIKKEAVTLKEQYESKLEKVDKEVEEILHDARKRALEKERDIVQKANDEAATIIARAELEVSREKEQIRDDIRREIIDVATMMASKFVEESMDSNKKEALIEETLVSMGESTWLN